MVGLCVFTTIKNKRVWVFREKAEGRGRHVGLLFHLWMLSWVASCMRPDRGWNPRRPRFPAMRPLLVLPPDLPAPDAGHSSLSEQHVEACGAEAQEPEELFSSLSTPPHTPPTSVACLARRGLSYRRRRFSEERHVAETHLPPVSVTHLPPGVCQRRCLRAQEPPGEGTTVLTGSSCLEPRQLLLTQLR